MPSKAGEPDELQSATRESLERFNDARNKLHKLMQRWDQLLPGERAVFWEDETQIIDGAWIADNGDIRPASVIVQLRAGLANVITPGIREWCLS